VNLLIFFHSLFPFWRISVTPPPAPLPADILAGAGIVLSAVSVLCLAVMLLARQATEREAFLSGATHALKIPLANIRLYADILKEKHGGPAESTFQFDTIIYQTEALSRRIDNVLTATRIGVAGREYHLQLRNLVEVVRGTLEVCRGWASHAGFELREELPDHEVECLIDGDAVSSALVSLVENAVKYSQAPSAIWVRVNQGNGQAVVEVQDEGVGIPQREHVRIFRQFHRGSTRAEKGGFGLGLFLVRHTMEHHNGFVRLMSAPAAGSRFQLIFPLCKPS
jgi:signal transduction histidine kinase